MKIAHCSDLHLLSLAGARVLDFANKRWIGGLNLLTNRGRHYHSRVFEAMVADFANHDLDHIICTGDVTNLAMEQEFHFAKKFFDRISLGSGNVTVLPGNHDAYVARGSRYFADIFAEYHRSDEDWRAPNEVWPVVRVRGPVAIIGLSTSHQTPWFTAWGRVGAGQLGRLAAVLADKRLANKLRLVAIHHPPAGKRAQNRVRGLKDYRAFAQVIAEHGAELIIHGHEHRDLRHELPGPNGQTVAVLGVQSATYAAHRPERLARYRIFDISDSSGAAAADRPDRADRPPRMDRPRVTSRRLRVWDGANEEFVDDVGPRALPEATSRQLGGNR